MTKVEYFKVNPAGNITIFVTTPIDKKDYANVASRLFELKEHKAEQVGFIKEGNRMEMSGTEFCGNASRAFALWYAKNRLGVDGEAKVKISVSGSEQSLNVEVNTKNDYTKIEMPMPVSIKNWQDVDGVQELKERSEGVLIDFGGILHLVLWNTEATKERFEYYNKFLIDKFDAPANGVMFMDKENMNLVPIVYVKDVETTYFEGSCGSGSTACAVALAYGKPDGKYSYDLHQPAGSIVATAYIENEKISKVFIEGNVEIGNMQVLEF